MEIRKELNNKYETLEEDDKKPTSQDIRKHYKWFIEHCKRFRKEITPYKQFKKEFIETWELNQTPEEQERLNNLSKAFNEAMEMLK